MGRLAVVLTDSTGTNERVLTLPGNLATAAWQYADMLAVPCSDADGLPLTYELRCERTDETLPPNGTLTDSGVMWGDMLVLSPAVLPPEQPHGGDVPTLRRQFMGGLAAWQADRASSNTHYAALDRLYTALTFAAVQVAQTDAALDVLQEPVSLDFLAAFPIQRTRQARLLVGFSRQFAGQQRYEAALEAALVAHRIFDPANIEAYNLSIAARDYVALHQTLNPADRLQLARAIYKIDPTFGHIGDDLVQITRGLTPVPPSADPRQPAEPSSRPNTDNQPTLIVPLQPRQR